MKGFIIVVAVAIIGVQAITDQELAEFQEFEDQCLPVSGVDPKLVQKARQGEFIDDPKLKELLFCVSKKLGFQNEAGQIQMDVIITKANEGLKDMNKAKELLAICDVQKETPQQTSFEMVKCLSNRLV